MTAKKHYWVFAILLIIVVCANLLNVSSVRADGEPSDRTTRSHRGRN